MLESGGFMNTSDIVFAIDAEIMQLQKVKAHIIEMERKWAEGVCVD